MILQQTAIIAELLIWSHPVAKPGYSSYLGVRPTPDDSVRARRRCRFQRTCAQFLGTKRKPKVFHAWFAKYSVQRGALVAHLLRDPDQQPIPIPTAFESTCYIGQSFETHARDLVWCICGNISAARDFIEIAIGAFGLHGHVDNDGAFCDKQWLHEEFSCGLKYHLKPFISTWSLEFIHPEPEAKHSTNGFKS